ncbi:Hypothetical predicted protein [Marmota monax]|uniref:LRRCT domain-containing protein n=1 Tax=Marmota monax TaxID=9995 RepID=A0A5E4B0S0_MARMO|nr:Hypothetical predicted protein [Marmota monax]
MKGVPERTHNMLGCCRRATSSIKTPPQQMAGELHIQRQEFLSLLRELDVSFNNISHLPTSLAEPWENLTLFEVRQNQLHYLDRRLLESMPSLRLLFLKDNLWKCNCHLLGLKLWLEKFIYAGFKRTGDRVCLPCIVQGYKPLLGCDVANFTTQSPTPPPKGDKTHVRPCWRCHLLEMAFMGSIRWNSVTWPQNDPKEYGPKGKRGGVMDGVICGSPDMWKGKDLLRIPHELYQPCPLPVPHLVPSQGQQHGTAHREVPKPPENRISGERDPVTCEVKPKPRPTNLRHAVATVVITGVVCGIVCLMMLVAAIYGCTYAAITAQGHRGPLAQTSDSGKMGGKEVFDHTLA